MAGTRALLGATAFVLASCSSSHPPLAPLPAAPPPPFSGPAAWAHLEALVEIGPRVPGSDGAERARAYVREELTELGIEVHEQHATLEDRGDGQPLDVTNLVGIIPGDSSDLFILAAALDTRAFETFEYSGAAAASGPALLLELAKSLTRDPLPYTVRLAFLGAEAAQGDLPDSRAHWSSRLLVEELREEGALDRVRLAVYFGQVADAELAIARDLGSHRAYRDAFFKAARRMGHEDVFAASMGFDSVSAGHTAFLDAGMRRAVVISDPRYGGDQPPGIYHHTEQDTLERLSVDNLDAVGLVSEQALRDISVLLVRVDRFAHRRSVEGAPSEPAQPPAADGPVAETSASPGVEEAVEPGEASEAAPEPGPLEPRGEEPGAGSTEGEVEETEPEGSSGSGARAPAGFEFS